MGREIGHMVLSQSPRKPEDVARQPMCADCWGTTHHKFHCSFWIPESERVA